MCVTHSSRSWVWDPALESHPLEAGSFPVCKRSVEDRQDVGHVVHTDSRTSEHRTGWNNTKHTELFNMKQVRQ